MAGRKTVTGIDIGTTKICTVIAETVDDSRLKIVGVGLSRSVGVKRGAVVNVEKTVEAIGRSVEEAQKMAGVKVHDAYVGIAGSHIQGVSSRAVIAVSRSSDEITSGDLDRVLEQAKAISIPSDRRVVHVLPLEFAVDDQEGVCDPVGMSGTRLEAEVHIVTAAETSARNVEKCVKKAGVDVNELVLESYASSNAVLEQDERDLGVILLDIGGGTTDITIFGGGSIRYTSTVGLGGENITSDIAIGLRTPLADAETLKTGHGWAIASMAPAETSIDVPGIGGRADREISQQVLCSIIESRAAEILEMAYHEASRSGMLDMLGGGVVVTGGTADLRGIPEMTEAVFEMPVKVGLPRGVGGLTDEIKTARSSTAVGLALYGWEREGSSVLRFNPAVRGSAGFQKIGNWFKNVVDSF